MFSRSLSSCVCPRSSPRIIRREIPAHIVAEDDGFIAILDKYPLVAGHTLVIPKAAVDYLFDQDDEVLRQCLLFSKGLARRIERVIPCQRVLVLAVVGLEVPHTHIHLVPLHTVDDLNFSRAKLSLSPARMEAIAKKIREA